MQALREIEAVSKGTRCRQYLFSLSLNPPEAEPVSTQAFEAAITEIEGKLGLKGQPRAVIFHEKEGRRHAHCVWSRIDTNRMTAINLPFYKRKLSEVARDLYLEHGWQMPRGLHDPALRDPLNFSRAEWQQAKRTKLDPRELRALFKECWERSDTAPALGTALQERGFWLARGDRRGVVAVDYRGEVYALARWSGVRAKDVKERIANPDALPSVDQIKDRLAGRMTTALLKFIKEVDADARKRSASLEFRRSELSGRHREERAQLNQHQQKRWVAETNERAARLPKGMKGIWHRITGRYAEIRQLNESETWQAHLRDQTEKDALILEQVEERRALQLEIKAQRDHQQAELMQLRADVARYQDMQERKDASPSRDKGRDHDRSPKRTNNRPRTPKP
ncbi:hypothetical protein SAMN04490244_107152 [Tranquillimonas rosea]|uniref:MobA/VirD2-like nuclease domain-containing protein n=2 Tax=Tranquillimonas rosea TaxID=641238 RepID=A0A1H9VK51_9RHOB|nr:hypothetical protein SAMN04490244_107152 [Tranquillimonas rosea]